MYSVIPIIKNILKILPLWGQGGSLPLRGVGGFLFLWGLGSSIFAQNTDSIHTERQLSEVTVSGANNKRMSGAVNGVKIGQQELIRAACCNLGESFTTNPSVDVAYSDAATGARQIKLLGLSGTYVQMMTENVPNLRGAALPLSLGFVPGPWMHSIQVSKGASSVKNGYESITGQINIEYLKPQLAEVGKPSIHGNAYLDSKLKYELNADASTHLTNRLTTGLLLHYEDRQTDHDGNNDGFMDMPKQRQMHGMWRMAYVSPFLISQLSVQGLIDKRRSGTSAHHRLAEGAVPYNINIENQRLVAQWKNGFTLNHDHNTSIALMLQGSVHDADNVYGNTKYAVNHKNAYAQLMFETDFNEHHNLSAGASLNHDRYNEDYFTGEFAEPAPSGWYGDEKETVAGIYAQYTYKLGEKLVIMPGIRLDNSSRYDLFVTPRLHVMYSPFSVVTFRASAGKGYRTPHAMAENSPLLASGRTFYLDKLKQEEAWNYGISAAFHIPVADKTLELNAEYYYTNFINQMVVNIDGSKGAHTVSFENLDGKSYSHVFQIDATYPLFRGMTATAAYRYNNVRCTYDGVLRYRPLTSRYKGMLTLSYKTPLELWQFDVTGQLNGKGEFYDRTEYPTYFQLQAQVTRFFRHFDIYIGGENLTGYKQKNPIVSAHNPWAPEFDATQVYAPIDGAMVYLGVRLKF